MMVPRPALRVNKACRLPPPPRRADGVFTPHWYNLVDFVNEERTLPVAFVKALAASVFYAPFANGLFLAGARTLRYGLKVSSIRTVKKGSATVWSVGHNVEVRCIQPLGFRGPQLLFLTMTYESYNLLSGHARAVAVASLSAWQTGALRLGGVEAAAVGVHHPGL